MASPKILRERSVLICFTTRIGGVSRRPYESLNLAYHVGDEQADVTENRRRVLTTLGLDAGRLTTVKQIHGNAILEIDEKQAGAGCTGIAQKEADALATSLNNTPIAVCTADCVPLILADVQTRKIIVVHAGWKGIYSLIVPRALKALKEAAHGKLSDVYAFIGPAIGQCCYEVDATRAGLFDERYVKREAGKTRLNLPAIVEGQLREAGLDEDSITDSGLCTCCRNDLLFSFRRDGICGRQMAVAALT